MSAVTIPVSKTDLAKKAEKPLDLRSSVESLLQRRVEAMGLSDERLVCCKDTHPFAQAAHDAFYRHYPLTFGPDDVWFCLAQGFARHVNLNAESLRKHFVQHEGKAKLVVMRADVALGQPSPWTEVFTDFSDQIAQHVGKPLRDVVVADFSTTTLFHRAATEVALMDAFQAYFEYVLMCGCGIPSITLTGAPDDWRDVRKRAATFAQYGLGWWVDALLPVLDQIEATSRGHDDEEFWRSFFRYKSGSGGSAMTGWIHVLFPYLRKNDQSDELVPNRYIATWQQEYRNCMDTMHARDWREREIFDGPYLGEIPSGVSSAPVKVTDFAAGRSEDMRFVAGMFGVSQDPATLTLSPSFGWAVVYDKLIPPKPREDFFAELEES